MDIGKQSTLNDLIDVSNKADYASSVANQAISELNQRGLGKNTQTRKFSNFENFSENGMFSLEPTDAKLGFPETLSNNHSTPWLMCHSMRHSHGYGHAVTEARPLFQDRAYFARHSENGFISWVEYLTTANTITDANGFIKAA